MSSLGAATVRSPAGGAERRTPLIQQIHTTAAHAICEIVERNLFRP
jgi:hypothetical protein